MKAATLTTEQGSQLIRGYFWWLHRITSKLTLDLDEGISIVRPRQEELLRRLKDNNNNGSEEEQRAEEDLLICWKISSRPSLHPRRINAPVVGHQSKTGMEKKLLLLIPISPPSVECLLIIHYESSSSSVFLSGWVLSVSLVNPRLSVRWVSLFVKKSRISQRNVFYFMATHRLGKITRKRAAHLQRKQKAKLIRDIKISQSAILLLLNTMRMARPAYDGPQTIDWLEWNDDRHQSKRPVIHPFHSVLQFPTIIIRCLLNWPIDKRRTDGQLAAMFC